MIHMFLNVKDEKMSNLTFFFIDIEISFPFDISFQRAYTNKPKIHVKLYYTDISEFKLRKESRISH